VESTSRKTRVVKFGVFEVDLEDGELRKSGVRQKLGGQPFQVLQVLLEHPQEIVSREQLQQRIWPRDTFVDYDLALKKAVVRIREVLGDSAESPRFIETIPRRGYRFIAPLNGNGSAGGPTDLPVETPPASSRRSRFGFQVGLMSALGAMVVLFAILAFVPSDSWRRLLGKPAAPEIRSLAVLPLESLSGDPAQEYFSDGMTDALITDLAQIGSVKVISRTSIMRYKKTDKPLPDIARELAVDGIVEGTVQRSGDRVRITAQLIRGPSDKHLWANSYERDVSDVFMLEREVAGDIARQVQARLATDNRTQLAHPQPINPAALDAYLQGNSHMHKWGRGFGDEELRMASQYFQQAIDVEPDFAPAYVGIANARGSTLRSSNEDVEIARKAAERAVELDPNLSDAWVAMANVRCDSWDWAGAEQDYRRALALNPNEANAHEGLSFLLDATGRLDEGWKEAEIAQQLDPNEEHLEPALDNRREYDQIIQHITTMLATDPDNGVLHHQLYEGYVGKGMYKEAFEQLEQTLVLFGFQESAAQIRQAFAASGYKGAMREWAKEFEYLHVTNQVFMPINLASAYTAAGDKDRAFYWLEQAYKRRGHAGGVAMVFVNRDPMLEPLHSDPRYTDLLRRVGLPP
jgi:TolB-like protein/DNA-binding winged helix-turn-helix (wHTH) protein